jgi:hypothetical protein
MGGGSTWRRCRALPRTSGRATPFRSQERPRVVAANPHPMPPASPSLASNELAWPAAASGGMRRSEARLMATASRCAWSRRAATSLGSSVLGSGGVRQDGRGRGARGRLHEGSAGRVVGVRAAPRLKGAMRACTLRAHSAVRRPRASARLVAEPGARRLGLGEGAGERRAARGRGAAACRERARVAGQPRRGGGHTVAVLRSQRLLLARDGRVARNRDVLHTQVWPIQRHRARHGPGSAGVVFDWLFYARMWWQRVRKLVSRA